MWNKRAGLSSAISGTSATALLASRWKYLDCTMCVCVCLSQREESFKQFSLWLAIQGKHSLRHGSHGMPVLLRIYGTDLFPLCRLRAWTHSAWSSRVAVAITVTLPKPGSGCHCRAVVVRHWTWQTSAWTTIHLQMRPNAAAAASS